LTKRHEKIAVPGPDRVVPPGPSTIDLHSHTLRSDGLLQPVDLVRAAASAGVTFFAITDHDTLAGTRELLGPGADPLPEGLNLIPGVEINAVAATPRPGSGAPEDEVHILGLGVDPDDEPFEAILSGQRAERRRRFARILERLRQLGMPIETQLESVHLSDDLALGRPTAARALVAAGHAASVEDAFIRWLGRDAPAYVPRGGLDPRAAIGAIRAAGGLPVLAHFWAAAERKAAVQELVDAGLGGIEVHHWSFDRPTVASVGAVARELHLVPSGGTDYHGDLGTYAQVHAGLWVPPAVGDEVRRALSLPAARP
jgi:predicted metal-dependent phosphoesterase TrpH